MSSLEAEKELVEEFVLAAFEKDDRTTVRRMLASDALVHTPNVSRTGLDADAFETQVLEAFHDAFPDLSVAIESLIAEGTTVICRFTMTGTHAGVFRGVEPSGSTVVVTGVLEVRLTDAGITELWQTTDGLELLGQITDYSPESAHCRREE
ncbi:MULTISPECIES: ester cyclase [Natrialbaceae]|uniref:Ester cyclase n=3 Tax=Natrialbaceae TaxID=1644061 RepID=L0AFR6_NATGS|nr:MULTISPECIES: ester cyclase [Natrialbaceae]AFZ72274.1 putative ester cyclase [Natronobacterium gregoryi SP2]ELY62325.1 hypothetical protein C490_18248 [Natronobacterium gregoryi SP2]EMA45257.1 hypothetical protein C446_02347 [Halobiforma nitratireducens JCM 10879]PLK18670.1 hypothetical protein CYV19_17560 [Natronobacterium gregoryi SP2]SFJ67722.1 conserved hypothetical protein, steroid delta-isomerase-related [Natronobacterium gregoryi]